MHDADKPRWFTTALKKPWGPGAVKFNDYTKEVVIFTLEGAHVGIDGDYIIQGVKGELYPCKQDIFELTYERGD